MVWVSVRSKAIRDALASCVLSTMDAYRGVFYAGGFLIAFEMAVMFNDLRSAAHLLLHASFHLLPVAGALLAALVFLAYMLSRILKPRVRQQSLDNLSGAAVR